jgi:hypothetical protein
MFFVEFTSDGLSGSQRVERAVLRDSRAAFMEPHGAEAHRCFEDHLVRAPAARNLDVMVRCRVLDSGDVSDATIVEPGPADGQLSACMLELVRATRFFAWPDRPPTFVRFPFTFRSER